MSGQKDVVYSVETAQWHCEGLAKGKPKSCNTVNVDAATDAKSVPNSEVETLKFNHTVANSAYLKQKQGAPNASEIPCLAP